MSGYAIIEELGRCAAEEAALSEKLKCASGVLLEAVSFDQCAIYLWDASNCVFVLGASAGLCVGLVKQYKADAGVPGAVKASDRDFCSSKEDLTGAILDGIKDAGMRGFRTALSIPIRDNSALYGVIYLKAIKRKRVSAAQKAMYAAASAIILLFIKYADVNAQRRSAQNELAQLHKQLLNSEKIMALADMAANIVHEIKSPLLSIGGHANRLKKHIPTDAPGRIYLDHIIHETERVEKVMDGMLRSIKDNALVLEPDDMNDIVVESVELFREEAEQRGVKIIMNLCEDALAVLVDREQVKIAFDNIIANALQSMENTGTLTVSTFKDKDAIVVKFADTGGGIDPRYESFIFNPFFTTKKTGTGLGLPIANAIVMRHNGIIEIDNNVGIGVTFIVKLQSNGAV